MVTVITFTKPISEFSSFFANGEQVFAACDFSECTEFWAKGVNSECLIYKGNQIVFSCCYSGAYDKYWITSVWAKDGCKFDHPIDYDEIEQLLFGMSSEVCAICKQASGCDQIPYDCPLCDFKGNTYLFNGRNGKQIQTQFKSRENAEHFAEYCGVTLKGLKK